MPTHQRAADTPSPTGLRYFHPRSPPTAAARRAGRSKRPPGTSGKEPRRTSAEAARYLAKPGEDSQDDVKCPTVHWSISQLCKPHGVRSAKSELFVPGQFMCPIFLGHRQVGDRYRSTFGRTACSKQYIPKLIAMKGRSGRRGQRGASADRFRTPFCSGLLSGRCRSSLSICAVKKIWPQGKR